MKICRDCKIEKPLSDFQKRKDRPEGQVYCRCKKCDVISKRNRWLEKAKDLEWKFAYYDRVRASREKRKAEGRLAPGKKKLSATPEQRQADRLKIKARAWVNNRVRKKKIIPQPCHCGAKGQAHHEDYNHPEIFTWVCARHHREIHVREWREKLLQSAQPCQKTPPAP